MGNNLCPIYDYSLQAIESDFPGDPSCSPCQIDPCLNGGTCVNTNGFFRCACPEGFNGIYCDRTATGPHLNLTIETSRRKNSGTHGRAWIDIIGSAGTSGPHFVAFGTQPDEVLFLPNLQLDFDVGNVRAIRADISLWRDGWRIKAITISPGSPSVFGYNVFLRRSFTLEGTKLILTIYPLFFFFFFFFF